MVRRHVTATLSIIGNKWLELVFSTSFLYSSHILIEFRTSDWGVSETSESVITKYTQLYFIKTHAIMAKNLIFIYISLNCMQ